MRFVPTNVPPPPAQEVRDTRMRMCRNNLGLAIECARALLSRFANQEELGSSRPAHRTSAEGDEHSLVLRFVGGVLRGVRESRERGGARWALSSAELVALFVAAGTHRGARAHALRVALLSEPTAFWADAHATDASESEAALSFLRVAVDTIVADVGTAMDGAEALAGDEAGARPRTFCSALLQWLAASAWGARGDSGAGVQSRKGSRVLAALRPAARREAVSLVARLVEVCPAECLREAALVLLALLRPTDARTVALLGALPNPTPMHESVSADCGGTRAREGECAWEGVCDRLIAPECGAEAAELFDRLAGLVASM